MEGPESRKNPRVRLVTRVRIRAEGRETLERLSNDISLGGIFIRMNPPLPVGREVHLTLALPETPGRDIEATGTVVWARAMEEPSTGRPAGIGVQFREISEETRRAIDALVASSAREP